MFEWDTFAVFEDSNAVTLEDFRKGEQRYVTIGMDAFGRILVVVYTWREENIRIISARKAVRYEVRQYEGEI
ncbi:MAG: BrnT family toxin [Deltaproteobacteria bacterium]|nr:BrnT family toxin [Deltaproteobacteria bacterium]